jgi:EAL domain-containing protein (putative c-di-GMP-specific phosphodiesterase class I)
MSCAVIVRAVRSSPLIPVLNAPDLKTSTARAGCRAAAPTCNALARRVQVHGRAAVERFVYPVAGDRGVGQCSVLHPACWDRFNAYLTSVDKVLLSTAAAGHRQGGTFGSDMSEGLARAAHDAADTGPLTGVRVNEDAAPLCFVVDEEPSIRHFLSLVLQGSGLDTQEFHDCRSFRAAITRYAPDLVFLNVPLESGEAIAALIALGKRMFRGHIQLMSNRGSAVLEHVKDIGDQHRLNMLPGLKKPFDTNTVMKIVQDLKLGDPPAMSAHIPLQDAVENGWVEFWYEPKVDLRRKQLVGAEAFARVRHPEHGVLPPGAFMPGADNNAIIALAELGLKNVLAAGSNFQKLGINLRFAINMPVDALMKLHVPDIAEQYHRAGEHWPGLIIDVTEEQIVSDISQALEITKQLHHHNVRLAIDDFGRGYSSLTRLKELPFAELKLDRTFVTDCGTDKVNAPLCKTVIDLAHNFGSLAVAIGIEKASDVVALVSMGCDCGQGFLLGQPMPEARFVSLLKQRLQSKPPPTSGPANNGSSLDATPEDRERAAAARRGDLHPLDEL